MVALCGACAVALPVVDSAVERSEKTGDLAPGFHSYTSTTRIGFTFRQATMHKADEASIKATEKTIED